MVTGCGGGGGGDYCLGFEETELRLGLPGGNGETTAKGGVNSKRGFSETIDLKLKLTTAAIANLEDGDSSCDDGVCEKLKMAAKLKEIVASEAAADPEKPSPPKGQVVGWPPVRSFRKNILSVKLARSKENGEKPGAVAAIAAAFVKVSMDGAPYLRKVDLRMYSSYQELSMALEKMFGSFTSEYPTKRRSWRRTPPAWGGDHAENPVGRPSFPDPTRPEHGNCGSQLGDFVINENKLTDLLDVSEYVPTYEDKDGDWMLVGDVPWEMFVGSCKRLRIMKGSEAVGLAPRAMEKRKNSS